MTPEKERLETMLAELTKELDSVGIHDSQNAADWIAVPADVDTSEPDSNVAADAIEGWDERRALVATLERQYNDITRALKKIESGTYGHCEVCEKPIETDRLHTNPAARTCKLHMEEEGGLSL